MPTLNFGRTPGSNFSLETTWSHSPRDANGVLLLRNNPFFRKKVVVSTKHPYYNNQNPEVHLRTADYNDLGSYRSAFGWGKNSYSRCFNRFRSGAWSDAQAALAVDLAERKETLGMLTSTAMRLYGAARDVRRGRFKSAAKNLGLSRVPRGASATKTFTSNWLAFRYGWVPLYSSVSDMLEVLDKPVTPKSVRARGSEPISTTIKTSYWTNEINGTWKSSLKARVLVSDPHLATLNQYGLANPLLVAWELVPFSFVADWFLPVGDYLENMSSFWGLSFADCCLTEKFALSEDIVATKQSWIIFANAIDGSVLKQGGCLMKSQLVVGSPPLPGVGISNGLNPKRAIDAFALLYNLLKGK